MCSNIIISRIEAVYGLKEYTLDLYQEYELSMIEEAYILDETNEGMGLTEEEIAGLKESALSYIEEGKKLRGEGYCL